MDMKILRHPVSLAIYFNLAVENSGYPPRAALDTIHTSGKGAENSITVSDTVVAQCPCVVAFEASAMVS